MPSAPQVTFPQLDTGPRWAAMNLVKIVALAAVVDLVKLASEIQSQEQRITVDALPPWTPSSKQVLVRTASLAIQKLLEEPR